MNENDIEKLIKKYIWINSCVQIRGQKDFAKAIMDKIKEDEKPVSFNSNWNEDIDR